MLTHCQWIESVCATGTMMILMMTRVAESDDEQHFSPMVLCYKPQRTIIRAFLCSLKNYTVSRWYDRVLNVEHGLHEAYNWVGNGRSLDSFRTSPEWRKIYRIQVFRIETKRQNWNFFRFESPEFDFRANFVCCHL